MIATLLDWWEGASLASLLAALAVASGVLAIGTRR